MARPWLVVTLVVLPVVAAACAAEKAEPADETLAADAASERRVPLLAEAADDRAALPDPSYPACPPADFSGVPEVAYETVHAPRSTPAFAGGTIALGAYALVRETRYDLDGGTASSDAADADDASVYRGFGMLKVTPSEMFFLYAYPPPPVFGAQGETFRTDVRYTTTGSTFNATTVCTDSLGNVRQTWSTDFSADSTSLELRDPDYGYPVVRRYERQLLGPDQ